MTKPDSLFPFYFAVPPTDRRPMSQVKQHIRDTFGIEGSVEYVRSETRFALYRLVAAPAAEQVAA